MGSLRKELTRSRPAHSVELGGGYTRWTGFHFESTIVRKGDFLIVKDTRPNPVFGQATEGLVQLDFVANVELAGSSQTPSYVRATLMKEKGNDKAFGCPLYATGPAVWLPLLSNGIQYQSIVPVIAHPSRSNIWVRNTWVYKEITVQ